MSDAAKDTTAGATDSKPVTTQAAETASAVKENVFSMFGGGPKKEKKEEEDDADEPSGSSKKQAAAAAEVCLLVLSLGYYSPIIGR